MILMIPPEDLRLASALMFNDELGDFTMYSAESRKKYCWSTFGTDHFCHNSVGRMISCTCMSSNCHGEPTLRPGLELTARRSENLS